MKNRNPKLLPFLLVFSALVHGAALYFVPPLYPRQPEPPPRGERLVMVNLTPPPAPQPPAPPEPPPPVYQPPVHQPPEPQPPARQPEPAPLTASPTVARLPEPAPVLAEIPGEIPSLPAAVETEEYAPQASVPAGEAFPASSPASPGEPSVPPGPPREEVISRYAGLIRSLIDREKAYPYQARRQEQEGTVEIRFTLSRQGSLVGEPALEKKSRYERLNASALEAVKNAAPYPPFPREIGEEEMSFRIAVAFSLR